MLTLVLFALLPLLASAGKGPTVGICITNRGGDDIVEHIEYHLRLGISKYYLIDHCSSPPLIRTTLTYARTGLMEYSYTCGNLSQIQMMNNCLRAAYGRVDFLAMIDSDEYIVLRKHDSLPALMRDYADVGALAINWMVFGSSGHVLKPPGGIVASYHMCRESTHVKQIVNVRKMFGADFESQAVNIHTWVPAVGQSVDENRQPVRGHMTKDHSTEIVGINHYYTRSLTDWLLRANRGAFSKEKAYFTVGLFEEVDKLSTINCTMTKPIPAKFLRPRPLPTV